MARRPFLAPSRDHPRQRATIPAVARPASVPSALRRRPFRADVAIVAGLITRRQLQSSEWINLYPGVLAHRDLDLTYAARCRAAALHRLVKGRLWHGTSGLPAVLAAADEGSESPMETRARLILVGGGLPRPVTQYTVVDQHGRTLGRLDLAYPEKKVGVEYEGAG